MDHFKPRTLIVLSKMGRIVKVISKEGQAIEMGEDVAVTSKYLQTVLKEDPNCESIQTNIPYESLDIAKRFCNLSFEN